MSNDRNPEDEQYVGPGDRDLSEAGEDRVRNTGIGEEIRSVADDEDDDFEDLDDLEDDEDNDSSF
jgi:hypothetical protein